MHGTDEHRSGRRSPNASELATWRAYVEASERVRRALSTAFLDTSGISPGDYSVMLALSEAEDRTLRSSDLATGIGWERSRLSHHLKRMEERGLVLRGRVGGDARGAAVTLTDAGASVFRSSSAAHLRLVRQVFVDAFTPDQLETMRALSATLHHHLDQRDADADRPDDDD
ncbi:MarR family transcriptional regulator [Curtobacterium sp. MCSS17_011]|uniref:MarR family winged helix-turn-helix transcriptional regulator n=1 Tax=Curtobacterium sp. MCSS17_011 TaxID=2175643 RepID=UPI000D86F1DD|nr:MarR family winged helix-turn-helix transcriptional regulator [Curtobacterium sp. MCSS17_011]PYY60563.1 MarR family transcriptional regulator [Curtobacterium sp. MCSS17_011]